MSKRNYLLYSLAATLVCSQAVGRDTAQSSFEDPCKSTAVANAGVVYVCPKGDGDPLTAPVGGGNCQITLTVRDQTLTPIPNIPAEDMWLVGCDGGLLLCGDSSGSNADGPTNALGQTTFSNEPVSGGCDTGLYVVVHGWIVQSPPSCAPLCLPIAARSPDYKSAGAPGPAPCGGDLRCPDSRVTSADFAWFATHFSTAGNPKPYHACADYAAPLGTISAPDFAKFGVHFTESVGHKCPI